jgi:hypothetical protein
MEKLLQASSESERQAERELRVAALEEECSLLRAREKELLAEMKRKGGQALKLIEGKDREIAELLKKKMVASAVAGSTTVAAAVALDTVSDKDVGVEASPNLPPPPPTTVISAVSDANSTFASSSSSSLAAGGSFVNSGGSFVSHSQGPSLSISSNNNSVALAAHSSEREQYMRQAFCGLFKVGLLCCNFLTYKLYLKISLSSTSFRLVWAAWRCST